MYKIQVMPFRASMYADEVKAEFDAMCDAIAADFKKSV